MAVPAVIVMLACKVLSQHSRSGDLTQIGNAVGFGQGRPWRAIPYLRKQVQNDVTHGMAGRT
jgi:hypothetical protein